MRTLCAILLVVCVGQSVYATNTTETHIICKICKCNPTEKRLDCGEQNLFKLFNDSDWTTVSKSNNSNALVTVDFSKNGIEVVTPFPKLDIQSLILRNNKIRKIELKAFQNLTLLEKLDLSENRLTTKELVKEVFEGFFDDKQYEPLKNLKWLNLANNDLHSLNVDVFDHLPNLETLYLGHNPFGVIDLSTANALSAINNLQFLDLSNMDLREIPIHMLHSPRELKTLNLASNILTKIPEALTYAINLIDLNLDDNPMVQIGGVKNSFPLLPKLEKLNLSDMHLLNSIDEGAFHNLLALRHFTCQRNIHLSTIHPHAFGNLGNQTQKDWPPLQSVILVSNNLSTISEQLFERWDEIEEIDIRFNRWQCTCENQWMVDKLIPLIKSKNKTTFYEDVKCAGPDPMKGKSFLELSSKSEQMRCEDYYGHRPERDGPILVGIFIGLIIGIPVTLGALFIYRRGCFGIFGYRPSPADYGRAFYKRTELREDLHM